MTYEELREFVGENVHNIGSGAIGVYPNVDLIDSCSGERITITALGLPNSKFAGKVRIPNGHWLDLKRFELPAKQPEPPQLKVA